MASRVLAPAYPIPTKRLSLRPIDPARDVDALFSYQSLPEVCRYIPWQPRTREDITARLADPKKIRAVLTGPGSAESALNLVVEVSGTGAVVGDVMLMWTDDTNAEIGYVISPEHQGRGYATEAAEALLDLAFDGLGVHRVTARIDERNPASGAVLAKLGMRQEGVLVESEWCKGEWITNVEFAILDREWRLTRATS